MQVVAACIAADLPIVVVNPRQVHDFAKALGQRAKTDRVDARVLARFARAVHPTARPLKSAAAQAVSVLVARRRQLTERLARGRKPPPVAFICGARRRIQRAYRMVAGAPHRPRP